MNYEIKESPTRAQYKGSNEATIKNSKLEELKEKYHKSYTRMAAIPGLAGMATIGTISTSHDYPLAFAGGAIFLGAGLLIAKTHQLILKRKIDTLEKEVSNKRK